MGILLSVLGLAFLLQNVFGLRNIMRGLLPAMLIGFGIYILRGYIFKPKDADEKWSDFDSARPAPIFQANCFRQNRKREITVTGQPRPANADTESGVIVDKRTLIYSVRSFRVWQS